MLRLVGRSDPLRVAIADDAGLIYSDDYRDGWVAGFRGIGADVQVFDVSMLRRLYGGGARSRILSVSGSPAKMIAENIVRWRPDLVWCHHGRACSNDTFLSQFKRRGIRTATYLCDEPYEVGETARYSPKFDHVFSMDPCTLEAHRQSRKDRRNVYYLPPGVDTDRFKYRPYYVGDRTVRRKVPAFFLGNASLEPRSRWLKQIEKLVDGADIRFWPQRHASGRATPVAKGHPLWIPAEDHPKWYGNCVVGLNVHRDPGITMECYRTRVHGRPKNMDVPAGIELAKAAPTRDGTGFWNDANLPACHVNPRFLEMAACGTLVVSDAFRSELDRMFPCAPQASDPDHFVELVLYYLSRPDEAEEIGRLCSFLISKQHSYRHRAAEVLIRVGLMGQEAEGLRSSLGEPEAYLTPQDWQPRGVRSWWGPTGRSERWSPASGLSWTRTFGDPSRLSSLDAPTLL